MTGVLKTENFRQAHTQGIQCDVEGRGQVGASTSQGGPLGAG